MLLNLTLDLFIYLFRIFFFLPFVHTGQASLVRACAEKAPHD